MRHRLAAVGILVLLAFVGAAVGALAGRSAVAKTTVRVTEREYRVVVSRTSLPAGPVLLVVHNAGRVAHRLSVAGPGLRVATTPTIQPGATRTLRLTLRRGTFTLWCPLPNHASAGMKTALRVIGPLVGPIGTSTNMATAPPGYGGY